MCPRRVELRLPDPEQLPERLESLWRSSVREGRPVRSVRCPLSDPREADYDAFFGVIRVSGAPALLLSQALATTVSAMASLPEAATEPALHQALDAAHLAPATEPGLTPNTPAQQRWIHGHRLFFTLTQSAIVGLQDALAAPRARSCGPGVQATRVFLRASAAAMRLTASFSRSAYERIVRPSMAPPQHSAEGFSGLWSADHRVLITRLRAWGAMHSEICRDSCITRRHLLDAVDEVYTAHIGICERFIGDGSSLLGGSENSLDTLGKLARHRGRLL
ncbi:hypothetical protein GCM10010211_78700 [Streptomyces albospinus]|uniref:Uncharacterized protein n=1 Tax=Streptomyces albospinus TaxID=285515 RepID=A0ABQ2VNC7_9ACTN|nr:hypothetical protein [Streptomyces albospinus]GGU99605.1 hypothetical protein GCM10010211_78700 [Streptomyces albospinus]